MRAKCRGMSLVLSVCLLAGLTAIGLGAEEQSIRKIQDNSFLLEEAYNQEPGVIQHIQAFSYIAKDNTWNYSFTEEWPIGGRADQISLTLPFAHQTSPGSDTQMMDALLNYRRQIVESSAVAFAPRISLVLPSGRRKDGVGSGNAGVQTNLPVSLDLGKRLVAHVNSGATLLPNSRGPSGPRRDLVAFNYGASLIGIVSDDFNFMLEAAGGRTEVLSEEGVKVREESLFISPGARWAFDFKSGLQVVPGIAFPLGIGPSQEEAGVFVYLSLEHPWSKLE